jgi:hypothetical protein
MAPRTARCVLDGWVKHGRALCVCENVGDFGVRLYLWSPRTIAMVKCGSCKHGTQILCTRHVPGRQILIEGWNIGKHGVEIETLAHVPGGKVGRKCRSAIKLLAAFQQSLVLIVANVHPAKKALQRTIEYMYMTFETTHVPKPLPEKLTASSNISLMSVTLATSQAPRLPAKLGASLN